ncbi:DUF3301 domain-containing protein [Caldichromatium japonicum]|uniref:DUF3301 domain-containing protein n=1 Tax=Caldichromatium japonicum TaxID=2699430 RepID=A0A6G7VB19_9GAMM|nr:DUF3301 domain-containing protein [Caldichromatium japonicum]
MSQLFLIFVLLLIGGLWLDGLRVREAGLRSCLSACPSYGVQLLDDTITLCQISLAWERSGMYVRRIYLFEFSEDGYERRSGQIRSAGCGSNHCSSTCPRPQQSLFNDLQRRRFARRRFALGPIRRRLVIRRLSP